MSAGHVAKVKGELTKLKAGIVTNTDANDSSDTGFGKFDTPVDFFQYLSLIHISEPTRPY